VPPALEEQTVAALWDSGCLGVQVTASGRRKRLTLDAYYPGPAGQRRLGTRLRLALRQAGLEGRASARLSSVAMGRWVERWQKSLRPIVVGPFVIVPEGSAEPAPRKGRSVLRVRFGQAFGTGEHPSTQMCLRLLGRHLRSGERVVDLGTGSAILAMAASRLGAGRVTAIDCDTVALEVAHANLRDNRLLDRIVLGLGDAADLGTSAFDLALVNIGAVTIERVLPAIQVALRPGGRAILSGILVDDERHLLVVAGRLGLRPIDRRRTPPWSALVIRKS
jgi:ribosomal protein L11 methyltransferase